MLVSNIFSSEEGGSQEHGVVHRGVEESLAGLLEERLALGSDVGVGYLVDEGLKEIGIGGEDHPRAVGLLVLDVLGPLLADGLEDRRRLGDRQAVEHRRLDSPHVLRILQGLFHQEGKNFLRLAVACWRTRGGEAARPLGAPRGPALAAGALGELVRPLILVAERHGDVS